MDIFYTYIYYDPSRNNEPIYVGKGHNNRAWKHLNRRDMHPFIQRLQKMKRNNIKPVIGLYAGFDEEFALFLEEELISKFGRKDLGIGFLLNLTDGGEGVSGYVPTPLARATMSNRRKGVPKTEEHRHAISVASVGKAPTTKGMKHTAAAKKKISKSNSGSNNPMFGVVPHNKGKTTPKPEKLPVERKKRKIVKCDVCQKTGDVSNMRRWHFDNCRNKE